MIAPQPASPAQQSPPQRVWKEYLKGTDRTRVETAELYVINTPEQFVQIQMRAWYATRTLAKPADQITLDIYSFSHAPLYRRDADRQLVAYVDGSPINLGVLSDVEREGGIPDKKGGVVFSTDKSSTLALRVMLPEIARVRADADKSLAIDMMSIGLKPSQVYRIANARGIELRVGPTRLPLTETHLSIFREFAAEIIPLGVVPSDEPPAPSAAAKFPDVPSDENKATLEATTKWLADALSKYGDALTLDAQHATHIEAISFKGCELKYRTVGRSLTSSRFAPAPTETRFDLADLNPARVGAVVMGAGSTLLFGTRDAEQKISVIYTTSKDDEKRMLDGASVALSKPDAAERAAVALKHAINLCQAQH